MEFVAITRGLTLCWEHRYRRVDLLTDCMLALGMLASNHPPIHQYAFIINRIKGFLHQSWVVNHSIGRKPVDDCLTTLGPAYMAAYNFLGFWDSPLAGGQDSFAC